MIYRSTRAVVSAWQWNGEEYDRVPEWIVDAAGKFPKVGGVRPFHQGDRSLPDHSRFNEEAHVALICEDGAVRRLPSAEGWYIVRLPTGALTAMSRRDFEAQYTPAKAPGGISGDFAQSFDGMVWATTFVSQFGGDVELMHAWFANAIMRGWDERARTHPYRPTWRERARLWFDEVRRKAYRSRVRIDQHSAE